MARLAAAGIGCAPSFDAPNGHADSLPITPNLTTPAPSFATFDSFAARWLMPRLSRFRRAHHDIDVRVATSERLADFVSDGIDIAIRCGGGQYPGLTAEQLMPEDHFPVCSPKLLKGRHRLRTPADLARHTLLHDVFTVDWAIWLRSAGIDNVDPQRGPTFLSSDHAIQAAVRGEGVVLGRSALVADDLAAGRLVRPFARSEAKADSDVDLAVTLKGVPRGFAYFGRVDQIEGLASHILKRRVDVVPEPAAKPRLRRAIEQDRVRAF